MKAILLNISHTKPPAGHLLCGLDVSEERDAAAKARSLLDAEIICVGQAGQLENPDARISFEEGIRTTPLSTHAICMRGVVSGDSDKWIRRFWEISCNSFRWKFHQSTVIETEFFAWQGTHH
ncbi:MAG: hypothetical protein RQM90_01205 [Methanoculleus sp.]